MSDQKNYKSASMNTASNHDDDDIESEEWNPTPEGFQQFVDDDFEYAQSNIQLAMLSRGGPMTVRDLKDSTLHSFDMIERVLASKIASGSVSEAKGKYSVVKA